MNILTDLDSTIRVQKCTKWTVKSYQIKNEYNLFVDNSIRRIYNRKETILFNPSLFQWNSRNQIYESQIFIVAKLNNFIDTMSSVILDLFSALNHDYSFLGHYLKHFASYWSIVNRFLLKRRNTLYVFMQYCNRTFIIRVIEFSYNRRFI